MGAILSLFVAFVLLMAAVINGCNTAVSAILHVDGSRPKPAQPRCKEHPLRPRLCSGPKPAPSPKPSIIDELIGQSVQSQADNPSMSYAQPPGIELKNGYQRFASGERVLNHEGTW